MFIGVNSPYLQMEVRREHVIRDALFQLEGKTKHDLKKQLRITFVGEEGIDEGGIQKEFFQIILKNIFDPTHGMFKVNPDSRLCWFVKGGEKDELVYEEYTLIGRLIAIAVYNGIVLDLNFPLALYKKLLHYPVELCDLKEYDELLGDGLEKLLNFEGNVEEVFQRTFQIEYENQFGERQTFDLRPNGDTIPVTNENREVFVDLFVEFYLNKSIEAQFSAFREGFDSVLGGSAVQLFRPEELEELICGSPDLDFDALEKVTQYDGFEPDSTQIK
ncbi:putative E3 ubiquitin-protein ligase HTD2 [Nowakowskiella sp. JEL0407]|nr:putative E3 ubiquitin-protein ligase HTD2 [Nowakowskiella sp. JEL0407]